MTEILLTPHEIADTPTAKPIKIVNAGIEFKDVVFNYRETRSVLKKFNLVIKPGEKVALVGPSGAGKSTILKLLLRQHEVTGGEILIDGQGLTHVTLESLWKAISLVPQDPILFHRTLKENIRYGRPGASDKEVMEAAKKAHCHEFIKDFPEGYDTYVGERGVKLSGGERQRVAIARAILRDSPILVLDEATSSLDSESELLIQDALKVLMRGKTVIVVAHRLSTIMNMDRIVVMEQGRVVTEGTHTQLLKDGGTYARLWNIQAGGFLDEEV
jgi:ATP-binding cassette subfamily B protein